MKKIILKNNIEEKKINKYYEGDTIKYFYENEYKAIIENSNKFYKLLYLALFETGARMEEIRQIRFKDINFDNNTIKVPTLKQRLKNKFRILTISNTLKAMILQNRLERNLNDNDYFLAKSTGKNVITNQAVNEMLKKQCSKLNIDIEKAHVHSFRHTRAIQLLEAGIEITKLKDFLGHKSLISTLVYSKFSNKSLFESIEKANKKIGLE